MQGAKRIVFDGVLIAVLHYVGLYMDFYWKPAKRGYRHNDPSLSYLKQENSITPTVLLIGSIYVPMLTMLLIDVISGVRRWDIYHNVVVFEIGGLLVYVSNNILKYYTGLQRPFFLSACQPNDSATTIHNYYVADPKCTGNERDVKIAGLTFPSLHSSVTAYGIIYFLVYLHNQSTHINTGYRFAVIAASLKVFAITWAVLVFMSRVLDHWHHTIDVISGAIWGLIVVYIVISTVLRRGIFKQTNSNTLSNMTSEHDSKAKVD